MNLLNVMYIIFKLLTAVFLLALNTYCASLLYQPGERVKRPRVLCIWLAVALYLTGMLRAHYPNTLFWTIAVCSAGVFFVVAVAGQGIRVYQSYQRTEMLEHPRFYALYYTGAKMLFARVFPIMMSFIQASALLHWSTRHPV